VLERSSNAVRSAGICSRQGVLKVFEADDQDNASRPHRRNELSKNVSIRFTVCNRQDLGRV